MENKLISTVILFLVSFFIFPSFIFAAWTQDDSGIQTFYQNNVPQLTGSGKVQYSYTKDSFFPLGLYHVDVGPVPDSNGVPQGQVWNTFHLNNTTSRNTLPELKTADFNTIMRFVSFSGDAKYPIDFTPNEYELNLLDSYGMKAFVEIHGPATWSVNNYNGWNLNALRSTIARIKVHPSVIGYHLFDEASDAYPDTWPMDDEKWKTVYDTIKAVDPDRPVFANANGINGTGAFHNANGNACFPASYNDASSFDCYTKRPQWGGKMDLVKLGQITGIHRDCLPNLPVVAIIQAFQNPAGGKLLPTPQEIRSQYYTVIVHGATGIAAFAQHSPYYWKHDQAYPWDQTRPDEVQGISPQVHADLWAAASQANHEIETWKGVFLAKTSTVKYQVFFDSHSGGMTSLLKDPGGGALYLLAVSEDVPGRQSDSDTHSVKFTFPVNRTITKVTSVFENTNVPVNENSFSASFRVGDVRFYKIEFTNGSAKAKPGDLNGDGKVDIFDYNILVGDFGKTGAPGFVPADIDKNGKVDIFDYNLLVANFGK